MKKNTKNQSGFTLVEILVSTAIFVMVVSAMLGMFNYTLKINRRVQALREVAQGTRAFAETITKEIRNGHIDYSNWAPAQCSPNDYAIGITKSLAIQTRTGDKLCYYFDNAGIMNLKRQTPEKTVTAPIFNSTNFKIDENSFRFIVRPKRDPNQTAPVQGQGTGGSPVYPQIQPFVTIVAKFIINGGSVNPTSINYQTTISTDVYDISK